MFPNTNFRVLRSSSPFSHLSAALPHLERVVCPYHIPRVIYTESLVNYSSEIDYLLSLSNRNASERLLGLL